MKKFLIVAVLAVLGSLLPASGGARAAADFVCNGVFAGGTYNNVVVPAGGACSLDNTTILGNVTVKTGADFTVSTSSGDSTIHGSVKGDACDSIDLESTGLNFRVVVGGDVTITNCTGFTFSGARGDSSGPPPQSMLLGGNVKCDNNAGGCVFDYVIIGEKLECNGNDGCTLNSSAVANNVTMNNNTGPGVIVDNSAIAGNLSCSGNAFASGSPNTVSGTKSGQCSGL